MELRTPSGPFLEMAKVWHEDYTLNHYVGFGSGEAGVVEAQACLDTLVTDPPSNIRLLAVWENAEPLGYVVFTEIDPDSKSGDLHITLPPAKQKKGLGPKVLIEAIRLGFRDGLYRITFKPFVWNKAAISAAYGAGFKLEARTKASVWTVDGPQDQAQMRVIKPEWQKKYGTQST